MKILKKLTSRLTNQMDIEKEISNTSNPYLTARFEWNSLFGDIRRAKLQWQLVAFFALFSNIFLIIALYSIAARSQLVPYIVKVDSLGNALYAGFIDKDKEISTLEVNAFLRQFIINARSIISDPFAQKRSIDSVYNASLPPVRKLLDSYYRDSNPFVLSKEVLVEVQVSSVVQKSTRTWQVDWVEIQRGLDGQEHKKSHFEALVTIKHINVNNQELLNSNPLGIYIEHLNWAKQD
jgi:type IV secretion system protein VirB5